MLDNSQNILVTGGTFTHVEQRGTPAFLQLRAAIADGAMHNSGERFDPPKCYPGTREVVLKQLLDWVIKHDRETFMRWLYGPAGAGKSAILQEIAEMCAKRKLLIAGFFFSRTASLRNDEKRLIATIAYQLAQSIPETLPLIEKAIERDPAVFSKSLDSQILSLIVEPLNQAYDSAGVESRSWPNLILVDGLDECGKALVQQRILDGLVNLGTECRFPLLLLVASRPETHITTVFNQDKFKCHVVRTVLDNDYRPEEDIRRFLKGKFKEIKESHPLCDYLPPDWPSVTVIEKLVLKSSGQFIYAATVARYVSSPDCHPAECLDVVLGLSSSSGMESPFSELDKLYHYILSRLSPGETSLRVLALTVFPGFDRKLPKFDSILGLRPGASQQILQRLSSLVKISADSEVKLLHASLADFVFDERRSHGFHINVPLFAAYFAKMCLRISAGDTLEEVQMRFAHRGAEIFCELGTPVEEVLNDLASFEFLAVAPCDAHRMTWHNRRHYRQASILQNIINQYMDCLLVVKKHIPGDRPPSVMRCEERLQSVITAEVNRYRTSALALALLAFYTVLPENAFNRPRYEVDFLLAPTRLEDAQDFDSAVSIDDSSFQLCEHRFIKLVDHNYRYMPFIESELKGEDFAKAAKFVLSYIVSYQTKKYITDEDLYRAFIASRRVETEGNLHTIAMLKYYASCTAVSLLTGLLMKASSDAELVDALRLTRIQHYRWEELDDTRIKALVKKSIDHYLWKSDPVDDVGGITEDGDGLHERQESSGGTEETNITGYGGGPQVEAQVVGCSHQRRTILRNAFTNLILSLLRNPAVIISAAMCILGYLR